MVIKMKRIITTYNCDRCGEKTKKVYNIRLECLFGYTDQDMCKKCKDSFRKWWCRDEKD